MNNKQLFITLTEYRTVQGNEDAGIGWQYRCYFLSREEKAVLYK
jgi:hypothetical protein